MKNLIVQKITLILFAILMLPVITVSGNSGAESNGIQFHNGSWNDVLKQAKEQDKIIFVDAYAVWCGPCKWMDANVFPQVEVGDFYNSKFINYKYDMEKGEGRTFAQNYRVTSYPTFLFINGDGEIVHRTVGAKPPNVLIEEGRKALQINEASR